MKTQGLLTLLFTRALQDKLILSNTIVSDDKDIINDWILKENVIVCQIEWD